MDALSALLSAELKIEKEVAIKRLGVDIVIKAMDGKTIGHLTEKATFGKDLDEQKFGGNIIASACVNLNFADPKLLEKYEASDAADCVQKALLAGEIAKLTQAIMELSGFEDMGAQVDKAKN